MQRLPVEVLECIVGCLSAKDLSRCCAVSKSWREVFSDDVFWKKHCDKELCLYLEKTPCCVEPGFTAPQVESSGLAPVSGWRLCFLREQHLAKNWRAGRYSKQEIVFDFDDSISYNIKVQCVSNDFVFLHTTFETEVWDVSKEPNLVFTIPFGLKELWERNTYNVLGNKLIVVQCNVVQIFKFCLDSKSWSFDNSFFFDRPQKFSMNITKETDINEIFKETSYDIGDKVECYFCGKFFVGIVTTIPALLSPVLHVWDIDKSEKLKEEKCSEYLQQCGRFMYFETLRTSTNKIILHFQKDQKSIFAVYCLSSLKFLASYYCQKRGVALLCDESLCIFDTLGDTVTTLDININTRQEVLNLSVNHLKPFKSWNVLGKKLIVVSKNDFLIIDPWSKEVKVKYSADFPVDNFAIIKDKYLAVHTKCRSLKEIMELDTNLQKDESTVEEKKGSSFIKLFSFPIDIGEFSGTNDVCSKMVLERANKLIILNFW